MKEEATNADAYMMPVLGVVRHEDDILFYDAPILFTIRDANEERYIGIRAKSNNDFCIHWFAKISDERYADLRDGMIDIREPFTQCSLVLVLYEDFQSSIEQAAWVPPELLESRRMPVIGARLLPIAQKGSTIS